MADFTPAFDTMIRNEGGYRLENVSGDRGGKTYAGIAYNYHPQWQGWTLLDTDPDSPQLPQLVSDFYRDNFWHAVQGDGLHDQQIAQSIFDFAVNAGVPTAARLAQQVAGVNADGIIGKQSLAALNAISAELFMPRYALAKIARYAAIVNKDASQSKFLLGWINRTLKGLA